MVSDMWGYCSNSCTFHTPPNITSKILTTDKPVPVHPHSRKADSENYSLDDDDYHSDDVDYPQDLDYNINEDDHYHTTSTTTSTISRSTTSTTTISNSTSMARSRNTRPTPGQPIKIPCGDFDPVLAALSKALTVHQLPGNC